MNEEIDMFLNTASGISYIESLSRALLNLNGNHLASKLEEVIGLEIELALIGAQKAKSEVVKSNKDSVVRPIK
jgi:hypothetical protein